MKYNIYDEESFFNAYSGMERSVKGLSGAGEWHVFKKLMPDLRGKRILDLGCGYGWLIKYCLENGSDYVKGIELSSKMTGRASEILEGFKNYSIDVMGMEEIDFKEEFHVVLSNLAVHYIEDFKNLSLRIYSALKKGGEFLFSCEHPVFTAEGREQFIKDEEGNYFWPVERYFFKGPRKTDFLGHEVIKYHRTMEEYFTSLTEAGFTVNEIKEPQPHEKFSDRPWYKDELKRPMMLIIKCRK